MHGRGNGRQQSASAAFHVNPKRIEGKDRLDLLGQTRSARSDTKRRHGKVGTETERGGSVREDGFGNPEHG